MALRVPGLVRATRLNVSVFGDHTIEASFVSNPSTGHRRSRIEQRWEPLRELGHGGFGIVTLEKCAAGSRVGEVRAVKKIRKGAAEGAIQKGPSYIRELEAIAFFSHELYRDHFVRSFGWYDTEQAVCITMEYLEHGDLRSFLARPLSEVEACRITHQILEGLEFMHENDFAHRDLKPANILVQHPGPGWWVKIADFGISKRIDDTYLRTQVGTEQYLAPEVKGIYSDDLEDEHLEKFSLAVDIWSVGIISFQILTGRLPFSGMELFNYVVRGKNPAFGDSLPPHPSDFVGMAMKASPRQRPSAAAALEHAWFKEHKSDLLSPNLEPISRLSEAPVKKLDNDLASVPLTSFASWTTEIVTLKSPHHENRLPVQQNTSPDPPRSEIPSTAFTAANDWPPRSEAPTSLSTQSTFEFKNKILIGLNTSWVAYSMDGSKLATMTTNGGINIHHNGRIMTRLFPGGDIQKPQFVTYSANDTSIHVISGFRIHTWNLLKDDSSLPQVSEAPYKWPFQCFAVSPDRTQLATVNTRGGFQIWSLGNDVHVAYSKSVDKEVRAACWSVEGHLVVGTDSTISIWAKPAAKSELESIESHPNPFGSSLRQIYFAGTSRRPHSLMLRLAGGVNYRLDREQNSWEKIPRQGPGLGVQAPIIRVYIPPTQDAEVDTYGSDHKSETIVKYAFSDTEHELSRRVVRDICFSGDGRWMAVCSSGYIEEYRR